MTTPEAGLPSIVTRPLTEASLESLLRCCARADVLNPATNNKSRATSGIVKRLNRISLVFIFLSSIFLSSIFLSSIFLSARRTVKMEDRKLGNRESLRKFHNLLRQTLARLQFNFDL